MSKFASLNAKDQAKVDAKLGELREKTGRSWTCEVTETPNHANGVCLLEAAVDGKILKPIVLDSEDEDEAADRICTALDSIRTKMPG
jgi:hypothetical protein